MNKEEIKPKVLYKITAYDSDYIKETPDKVRTFNGNIYYYYEFKKHRYLSQFVSDDFDIYDELKSKQEKIDKAINVLEKLQDWNYYDGLTCEQIREPLEILKGDK